MNNFQSGDHAAGGMVMQQLGSQMRFNQDFFASPNQMVQPSLAAPEKKDVPMCTDTGIYLMRDKVEPITLSGNTNLIAHYSLETTYNKFCGGKKVKEPLSSFLPDLPGFIDTHAMQDDSSLKALIERPPVANKEIQALSQSLLSSFRLHPGPLPEHYRAQYQSIDSSRRKNKHHKKHRSDPTHNPLAQDGEEYEHKKHKKKKHDDSEKKKKKKDKKKKREKDKDRN